MTFIAAAALALLQGTTELFPVSSLGHAVLWPALLGISLDMRAPSFLPFLVMLHLGTAAALLLYFWDDWWRLARGLLGLGGREEQSEAIRIAGLIVIATLPAVVIGFIGEGVVRRLFAAPLPAALFLVANGVLLIAGERLRSRARRPLSSLTARDALLIGLWQCAALLPGISRSGASMVGGLKQGIDHEGAAHFSFLIGTPIIVAATVLEVPKLWRAGMPEGVVGISLGAAVIAGLTAYASTAFLMRYFRRHDDWALDPFGYYCLAFGGGALLWLALRG